MQSYQLVEALTQAILVDDLPECRLLLQRGAPLDLPGLLSPWFVAVCANKHTAMRLLLEHGADPNGYWRLRNFAGLGRRHYGEETLAPEGMDEMSALAFALAYWDDSGDAVLLAERPIPPEALKPKLETLAILLEAGADPKRKNRAGLTPLDEAYRTRCPALVQCLT